MLECGQEEKYDQIQQENRKIIGSGFIVPEKLDYTRRFRDLTVFLRSEQ